jgi:myo-inositol-1(or 4)-monophosphatase
MSQPPDPAELRLFAKEAAKEAGLVLQTYLLSPRQVQRKGFRDLVTDADLAAQKAVTEFIGQRHPDHGFLTEESDPSLRSHGRVLWIIDPLDGTSNYSRGIRHFGVSVAAAISREPTSDASGHLTLDNYQVVAGAVYDPVREELFTAARGHGATLNGSPIRVSETSALSRAFVAIDWSRDEPRRQKMLDALGRYAHKVHSVRAFGSATLALAWLACGRLDAYCNYSLSAWDLAAAGLLTEEAGGRVDDIGGRPWSLSSTDCFASNGRVHRALLDLAEF